MRKYIPLALRVITAIILLQTLRFKFTAHPNSIYIFQKVGMEPTGRIIVGAMELVASVWLLIPKTIWAGALLTTGIIGSAIFLHLTKLGVEVNNDGGLLFGIAILTFILSTTILYIHRKKIPSIYKLF